MANLRYCVLKAGECGEIKHPPAVMEELGIAYRHSTPVGVGEQWWFLGCENLPEEVPAYLTPLDLNPAERSGFAVTEPASGVGLTTFHDTSPSFAAERSAVSIGGLTFDFIVAETGSVVITIKRQKDGEGVLRPRPMLNIAPNVSQWLYAGGILIDHNQVSTHH